MEKPFEFSTRTFGNIFFISCQSAKSTKQNYLEEFKSTLDRITSELKKNTFTFNDVAQIQFFYVGFPNLSSLWDLFDTYCDLPRPAVSLIGVHHLPHDSLFAAQVTAIKNTPSGQDPFGF